MLAQEGASRARSFPANRTKRKSCVLVYMARWAKKWHKVKKQNNFLVYTCSSSKGQGLVYNDFALYNSKGAVCICYHGRDCGDIDERQIRRTLGEYFRQYGKRIVIVEKCGKRSVFTKVEVYFLYPELPTDAELETWFTFIKNKVHA